MIGTQPNCDQIGGPMTSTLNERLIKGALAALGLGLLFIGLGAYSAFNPTDLSVNSPSDFHIPTSTTLVYVLNALGGFCITVAVVCVAGFVASLVVGEYFSTGQESTVAEFDEDDDYEDESG